MSKSDKAIYKFRWDVRRMGVVEGVFIATKKEVAAAIGKHVCFGEILGKHSEIEGTLGAEDLTVASDDPKAVAMVYGLGILPTGYNPLDYLPEEDA